MNVGLTGFLRSNRLAFLSDALASDLHFFHALRLAAASSDVIKLSLPMSFSTVVVSPIPSISKADSRNNLSYSASSARRFAQYSSYSRGWLTLCMVRLTTKTENVMKIIAEGQFFFKKFIGRSDNSGWGTGNLDLDSAAQGGVSISPVDCQRLSVYLRKMQEGHAKSGRIMVIRSWISTKAGENSIARAIRLLDRSAAPYNMSWAVREEGNREFMIVDRFPIGLLVGVLDYAGI